MRTISKRMNKSDLCQDRKHYEPLLAAQQSTQRTNCPTRPRVQPSVTFLLSMLDTSISTSTRVSFLTSYLHPEELYAPSGFPLAESFKPKRGPHPASSPFLTLWYRYPRPLLLGQPQSCPSSAALLIFTGAELFPLLLFTDRVPQINAGERPELSKHMGS